MVKDKRGVEDSQEFDSWTTLFARRRRQTRTRRWEWELAEMMILAGNNQPTSFRVVLNFIRIFKAKHNGTQRKRNRFNMDQSFFFNDVMWSLCVCKTFRFFCLDHLRWKSIQRGKSLAINKRKKRNKQESKAKWKDRRIFLLRIFPEKRTPLGLMLWLDHHNTKFQVSNSIECVTSLKVAVVRVYWWNSRWFHPTI